MNKSSVESNFEKPNKSEELDEYDNNEDSEE